MREAKEQNVRIKPFKWADLTLIIQFDFCPQCKYFERCYGLKNLAEEYDRSCVIKGKANYISPECGDNIED